jgi:hypothetical protein
MVSSNGRVRLRQAVLLAEELEPVVALLRGALGLQEPFRDPGVAEFGLVNAVFSIGDCFLEVISPSRPGTAAGRQLERAGADGGYMVLFDLEDLTAARERAAALGVRTVWQIDLPDISGTHMHPSDLSGAIVSLDGSRPYGTWRWGGPQWTGQIAPPSPPGRLLAIGVAVAEPQAAAARWGEVLGVTPALEGDSITLPLDGGEVRFRDAGADGAQGIVEIDVALPAAIRGERAAVDVGAARIRLFDLDAGAS